MIVILPRCNSQVILCLLNHILVLIIGTAVPPNTTAPAILAASNLSNTASNPLSNPTVSMVDGGSTIAFDEVLKATPPALVAFLTSLPAVEGNLLNSYCSFAPIILNAYTF